MHDSTGFGFTTNPPGRLLLFRRIQACLLDVFRMLDSMQSHSTICIPSCPYVSEYWMQQVDSDLSGKTMDGGEYNSQEDLETSSLVSNMATVTSVDGETRPDPASCLAFFTSPQRGYI
jgi:hypothetical protein